jgi:hypothetical protein
MEEQKVNDKYTLEQVIAAIKGSNGIKATIQRRLGCKDRKTVDSYLTRYATAQQAYDEEIEVIGDLAESVVISAIKNKDVDTAKWYIKAKLKSRGYSNETEHSGELILRVTYGNDGTNNPAS